MDRKLESAAADFQDVVQERGRRREFTVSVFGAGKEGTPADREAALQARMLGEDLVRSGFSIATGGYGGVMKAASEGALTASKEAGIDPKTAIKAVVFEDKTKGRFPDAEQVAVKTLAERLSGLIDESKAFIVLGGGFGTIVELVVSAHSEFARRALAKEKGVMNTPRPIIILDSSFDHANLIGRFARKEKGSLGERETLDNVYVLGPNDLPEVLRIVENYYQQSSGDRQQAL
jgi:predicted Rossmann-fold nucleotide-binding protein